MLAIEYELKAGLSRAEAESIEASLTACAGPGVRRLLVTRYFDTADRALAAIGAAVRIRRDGRRGQLMVKLGMPSIAGYRQAREMSRGWAGTRPDLAAVPDPDIRGALQAAVGEAPLHCRFTTRVERTVWRLTEPLGQVEVALDRGQIRAGRRAAHLCEIEFELLGGSPEAVFGLAERLLGPTAAWLALPGKAERGATLAAGESLAPRLAGGRPPAEPGLDMEQGFGRLLGWLAAQIATALHLTLTSDGESGPHQLRVALRRLRAAVRLFRPALRKPVARALLRDARDLGRIVSPLRDADVLIPRFLDAARSLRDPDHATRLSADLDQLHERLRSGVRRQLKDARATGFVVRLLSLAALGGWQGEGADRRPVGELACAGLERHWRRLRPLGDRLGLLDAETRHEFRKKLKIYRYSYELYGFIGLKDPYLGALKKLQVDLGQLNDAEVMAGWTPTGADPATRDRLMVLKQRLAGPKSRQALDLAMGRAVRHWAELRALPAPWSTNGHRPTGAPAESSR